MQNFIFMTKNLNVHIWEVKHIINIVIPTFTFVFIKLNWLNVKDLTDSEKRKDDLREIMTIRNVTTNCNICICVQ